MQYPASYFLLIKRFTLLFVIYTICRFLFLLFNWTTYSHLATSDLLFSFFHGWRFDISAIFYINALFVILSLLPFQLIQKSGYQRFLQVFFVLTNAPFILMNLVDIKFIQFANKRISGATFGMVQDIGEQFGQLLLNYWYIVFLFLGIIWILWKYFPMLATYSKKINVVSFIFLFLLTAALMLIGMRGGLQKRPIQMLSAFGEGMDLGQLTLNSPFSFLNSLDKKKLKPIQYFNPETLSQQLPLRAPSTQAGFSDQNIVLIILESFGAEYTGFMNNYKGYTPFLDSLANEGQYFRYALANGSTSAESAPSILTGIPSLMDAPILFSVYQTNPFYSIFKELNKDGYESLFFHGGKNGTMGFEVFTKSLGFQYFGLNEYPNKGDHDGNWGIFDEPYFQYCANALDKQKAPFIATIYSLSSHQPYTIPVEHQGRFPKGEHPIHESVGYTDYALKQFFNKAQSSSWYDNTLFIITADHTHHELEKNYKNTLGHLKIPLILFHPKGLLPPIDQNQLVQQTSIPASILDYLDYPTDGLPKFSHSVLNSNSPEEVLYHSQKNYYLIKPQYYLRFFSEQFKMYDWQDQELTNKEILESDKQKLKAYIQYYNSGMINNDF